MTSAQRAPSSGSDPRDDTRRLVARCAKLDAPPAALALAVAWQRLAAESNASAPRYRRPIRHFPTLEELDGPEELAAALDVTAVVWPHVAEHLDHMATLLDQLPRWGQLVRALDAELVASCARHEYAWADPAGEILQQLRSGALMKRWGVFYTPPEVVALMIAANPPQSGQAVLDPACGSGRMLAHAASSIAGDPRISGFFGVDLDADALAVACLNLIAAGAGPHVWLHRGDALATRFVHPDGTPMRFACVLANPPFGGRPVSLGAMSEPHDVVVDTATRARAWIGLEREAHEPAAADSQPGEAPPARTRVRSRRKARRR